jgi:hypothetical protein
MPYAFTFFVVFFYSSQQSSFLYVNPDFLIFILPKEHPLTFLNAELLVMNSLSLFLKSLFYCILNDIFTGNKIMGWKLFLFSIKDVMALFWRNLNKTLK